MKARAGGGMSFVINKEGTLYSCGIVSNGRLALEHIDSKKDSFVHEFTEVSWFRTRNIRIRDVACGNKHGLALTAGERMPGTTVIKPNVYMWGSNEAY